MDRLEELETIHAQEARDLEVDLDKLRKSIDKKADKAKKRGVNAKIESLKRELEVRQEEERYKLIIELQKSLEPEHLPEPTKIEPKICKTENDQGVVASPKSKGNRHQKKKERKRAELQRMQDKAEDEARDLPNLRKLENEAIELAAKALDLEVFEITPDGHCLYSSIADQLSVVHNSKSSFTQVRKKASEYLLSHQDDFLPFLSSDNGEMLNKEKYTEYCSDVANTATWGGQIEISALSKAYEVPIMVLQKDSSLKIGIEEFPSPEPLKISYHRHAYGLGCHYNSLRPKLPVEEFKDLEI